MLLPFRLSAASKTADWDIFGQKRMAENLNIQKEQLCDFYFRIFTTFINSFLNPIFKINTDQR